MYKIIEAFSVNELLEESNKLINEGYLPLGGPVEWQKENENYRNIDQNELNTGKYIRISMEPTHYKILIQAMFKGD